MAQHSFFYLSLPHIFVKKGDMKPIFIPGSTDFMSFLDTDTETMDCHLHCPGLEIRPFL